MPNFDSAWKEALEVFFQSFMAFFFPDAHREIDWSRDVDMLETELQQITRESEQGGRVVDKLVKVWRTDGRDDWVLIHVEVQSQPEVDFGKRMFVYNYRLFDRYNRRVASFAILGDDRPAWRPDRYGYKLWGTEVGIRFATAKLLDYAAEEAKLESDPNPFAVMVLAHLKALETAGGVEARKAAEVRLVKGLYARGFSGDEIRQLYRLIDTMMSLPKPWAELALKEIYDFEQEKQMPLISTAERLGHEAGFAEGLEKGRQEGLERGLEQGIERGLEQGIERGRQETREGLLAGIETALELKFSDSGRALMPDVRQIHDVELLRRILDSVKAAASADELRRLWQQKN